MAWRFGCCAAWVSWLLAGCAPGATAPPLPSTDAGPPDTRDARDAVAEDRAPDATPRAMRPMHGCDPAGGAVVDLTAEASPTILVGLDFSFRPACARVRVGQRVTFRGDGGNDWRAHPLRAGVIEGGAVVDDLSSPIPHADTGEDDVTVTFAAPGTYGYYCTRHWSLGFFGTLHAVP